VTQEELNCWRQRAGDVPANSLTPNCSPVFVNTGDYPGQPNSPADWTNVVNDKNSFMSNPNINDFNTSPVQIGTCNWANSSVEVAGNIWGHIMRASFYAMVRQNAPDRSQVLSTVINKLQQYATDPKLNFNDTTTWCKTSSGGLPGLGAPPMFGLAIKMTEIVHAYDYWSIATGNSNATVENWLRGALNLYVAVHDFHRRNTWWIDPDNGNYTYRDGYTSCAYPSQACMSAYWGGPVPNAAASWFNNRAGTGFELMAAIANLLNDSTKLPKVKKYFEEVITYGTIPDVSVNGYNGFPSGEDIIRWWDGCPGSDPFCKQNGTVTTLNSHGFAYSFGTLANLMSMADVYARNGDPSLFEFTTTSGQAEAGTLPAAGIVKSLRNIMRNFSAYARQDVKRTAGGNATGVSNTAPIMQGMLNGIEGMIHDTRMLVGNLYYNDPYVKAAYMRTYTNAPKWINGSGGQLNFWAINYPTMLFQRGLLEGVVNPYPTSGALPSVSLTASPSSISLGGSSTLTWGSSNATSCTASASPADASWSGAKALSGTQSVTPTQTITYTLTCTNVSGSTSQTATVTPSLSTTPIGWWKLDETSGSTASDASGGNNTGTLINGPTWSTGKAQGALNFDGVNDYVRVEDSSSLDISGSLSMSAWVYARSFSTATPYLRGVISKYQNNATNGPFLRIGDGTLGNNKKVQFGVVISGVEKLALSSSELITNRWYHLVGVYDGSNVMVYIDGVDKNSTVASGSITTRGLST